MNKIIRASNNEATFSVCFTESDRAASYTAGRKHAAGTRCWLRSGHIQTSRYDLNGNLLHVSITHRNI